MVMLWYAGTSEMGRLLSIEVFYTLVCVLLIMPSLLGAPKHRPQREKTAAVRSSEPALGLGRRTGKAH